MHDVGNAIWVGVSAATSQLNVRNFSVPSSAAKEFLAVGPATENELSIKRLCVVLTQCRSQSVIRTDLIQINKILWDIVTASCIVLVSFVVDRRKVLLFGTVW